VWGRITDAANIREQEIALALQAGLFFFYVDRTLSKRKKKKLVLKLNVAERRTFLESLLNAPKPNAALQAAVERHRTS
jgi:hypothetical protein